MLGSFFYYFIDNNVMFICFQFGQGIVYSVRKQCKYLVEFSCNIVFIIKILIVYVVFINLIEWLLQFNQVCFEVIYWGFCDKWLQNGFYGFCIFQKCLKVFLVYLDEFVRVLLGSGICFVLYF